MRARPPDVVSGLPNMTPIFSRIWLVKMMAALERLTAPGELPERLAHQAGLQSHVRVAHLALDLGPGHERRDRVHHDHVHRVAADQHLGDLQRLLARVRLRDQEVVHVDPQLARVLDVERVLGVDEGRDASRRAARWRSRGGQSVVFPDDSGP